MNARDAIAIEYHRRRRFDFDVDTWVMVACFVALVFGLVFASMHPQPSQVPSCYQSSAKP